MAKRRPYGTWPSPINAAMVAKASRAIDAPIADETGLYWLESRPEEQGRSVIVHRTRDGAHEDVTPAALNVRTRVHEYGGGAYHVIKGTVYFANFADQGLYRQRPGEKPARINPSDGLRYADCDSHGRRLYCVREDHRAPGLPRNALVRIDLDAPRSDGEIVFDTSDFVAYPRVDASGLRLAFIAWDFPNMPWDDVALWVADIGADGGLVAPRRINTGVTESILQPAWAEDGTLYFLSDRGEGWWNLHRFDGRTVRPVLSMHADFGGPLWSLGVNFYSLLSAEEAVVRYGDTHGQHLAKLDLGSGELAVFDLPFSAFGSMTSRAGRV